MGTITMSLCGIGIMSAHERETVLVTGAASGIGNAIAEAFASEGWDVYATDIDEDGLAALERSGCETRRLDVTDGEQIEQAIADILEATDTLDCLVNNAGYGELGPLEDVPIEDAHKQFDVNVHGQLRMTQAVLPEMREHGGRIINVSSVLGRVALPGMGAYSGSKFALEGMTDALRRELSEEPVDVVLVEPAWVETDFARASRAQLDARDQTAAYEWVYQACGETPLLDGSVLAVEPDDVASVVLDAALVTSPQARYRIGWQASLINATSYLPTSVADAVVERVVDLAMMFRRDEQ